MRVALIGNMNNNHFAMMRYFRDLGVEAYLFIFANEASHFQPKCDTYEYEKWAKYIIQTHIRGGDFKQYLTLSSNYLYNLFTGFDFYIGNDYSPAYLSKAGIRLNIFLPYATGIEYTFRTTKTGILDSIKEKLVSIVQIRAIKNNVDLLCTIEHVTEQKAIKLGVKTKKLAIPMVYNNSPINETNKTTKDLIEKINKFKFKVFSHVSHFPIDSFAFGIKRNDILLRAFAHYIKVNPNHGSVLILLEYGEGVTISKKLLNELGIEDKVLWLPKMERKEIMQLIEFIDLGASEFGGYIWGGTGWEFLSKGKLFIHYTGMTKVGLHDLINMPVPEFIDTNDTLVISNSFQYYYENRTELKSKELELKMWFNEYAGINLVKKYIDILKN